MPRCNNMSLRCTKCKVEVICRGFCGTLMQIHHKTRAKKADLRGFEARSERIQA